MAQEDADMQLFLKLTKRDKKLVLLVSRALAERLHDGPDGAFLLRRKPVKRPSKLDSLTIGGDIVD